MRGLGGVLRRTAFGRLAVSYVVNDLGDGIGVTALALLVFNHTGDAWATTALFIAGKFAPALLAPALTARVDQLPVRRVLPALYLVEGAAFAVLAATADAFLLPLVLALALLDGALAIVGRALTRTATAALLEPTGQLREGNAVLNLGFSLSSVAGPALGGLLVAGPGAPTALAIDAASFIAIALIIAGTRGLPARADTEPQPWRDRVRAGLAYVRGRPLLRGLLGLQAVALVFFAAVVPIEVVYVRETLDAGAIAYGAMLGFWGAGMVLGSLVFAGVRRRGLALLVAGSTALIGIAYLGIAAAGGLAVAYLASVVGGIGNGIQWIAVVTTVQEAAPGDMQARILGLLESLAAAMPGVGFLVGGALTAAVSPRLAFAVSGAAVLALVAAGLVAARRRGLPSGEPAVSPGDDGCGGGGGAPGALTAAPPGSAAS